MSHHDEMSMYNIVERGVPANPQVSHAQHIVTMSKDKSVNEDKQVFKSGAASSGNVARYDLITVQFLDRLGERLKLGAVKYGPFQYRKGLKDKDFILDRLNHAIRHIRLAQDLIHHDLPFDDDDLAGAVCSIMFAMEYQEANCLLSPDEVI